MNDALETEPANLYPDAPERWPCPCFDCSDERESDRVYTPKAPPEPVPEPEPDRRGQWFNKVLHTWVPEAKKPPPP